MEPNKKIRKLETSTDPEEDTDASLVNMKEKINEIERSLQTKGFFSFRSGRSKSRSVSKEKVFNTIVDIIGHVCQETYSHEEVYYKPMGNDAYIQKMQFFIHNNNSIGKSELTQLCALKSMMDIRIRIPDDKSKALLLELDYSDSDHVRDHYIQKYLETPQKVSPIVKNIPENKFNDATKCLLMKISSIFNIDANTSPIFINAGDVGGRMAHIPLSGTITMNHIMKLDIDRTFIDYLFYYSETNDVIMLQVTVPLVDSFKEGFYV